MLTNKQIKEEMIAAFELYKHKVINSKVGNRYYLFTLGDEAVIHFKLKGCKRWLFGMWISRDEEAKKIKLYLFGEHEDYIDKFKPTATKISESVEFSDSLRDADVKEQIKDLVWSAIYEQIDVIRSSNIAGKIKFYYHGFNIGLFSWLISQWWFYRVRYPFEKWLKYEFNGYVCAMICFFLNARYHKILKASYEKTSYFSPTYEISLKYKEGVSEDAIDELYEKTPRYVGFSKSIYLRHIPFMKQNNSRRQKK